MPVKMKILMILESEFPPDIRVENEMLALTEAGHEVHLACSTRKNLPEKDHFGGIIIHRKRMSSFIYKSSVGCLKFSFYFNFWRSFLFAICSEEMFEVVHVNDLPLSKVGLEIKKKFNTRLVIDLHENWPALLKTAVHTQTTLGRFLSSNKQWVEYEKIMLPQADRIITIIEEARERVIGLGVDPDKISIVSNTVNYENLKIRKGLKNKDFFTIFYGGAINRHRGLQLVLEAIRMCVLKKMQIRLWIVGDGSFRKELETSANKLNIGQLVQFWGHKPFTEMLEILSDSDAAIIPHIRNENNDASSPNKLYQYMYLNIPIISSDCTSLKRVINETQTGFIYKNDSPEDLFLLFEKLYKERNILENISGNGRKAVLEKYNWNIDKIRLINAYKDLSCKTSGS
jgi:glycosyltransferase involved in cell wall biosynthesis